MASVALEAFPVSVMFVGTGVGMVRVAVRDPVAVGGKATAIAQPGGTSTASEVLVRIEKSDGLVPVIVTGLFKPTKNGVPVPVLTTTDRTTGISEIGWKKPKS